METPIPGLAPRVDLALQGSDGSGPEMALRCGVVCCFDAVAAQVTGQAGLGPGDQVRRGQDEIRST